jgi:hypothetical protein
MTAKRFVWVLGAGFSAGLGGPLLTNLFTKTSKEDVRVRYKKFDRLFDNDAENVRWLYDIGTKQCPDRQDMLVGETIWSNAEEFIDYLDTACEESPKERDSNPLAERLRRIFKRYAPNHFDYPKSIESDCNKLRAAARRLIAAECSAFLEGADIRREQWDPFRGWAKQLDSNDTIISFNYDRVLEMLRDDPAQPAPIYVFLPDEQGRDDPELIRGKCPVYKLHGSVDWKKHSHNGKVALEATKDDHFALACPDTELAIATPGPSKQRETKDFRHIWRPACKAIVAANVIIFIGYRFPETDAYARETLLKAIRDNKADKLALHAALGRKGPDSERDGGTVEVCVRQTK